MTTQEEINCYQTLNRFFKSLYYINRIWFEIRDKIDAEGKKELFDLVLEVMGRMDKLKFKLIDVKNTASRATISDKRLP